MLEEQVRKWDDTENLTVLIKIFFDSPVKRVATNAAIPGIGKTTFEITSPEKFFVASDYVSFDDVDHGVRIEDDGSTTILSGNFFISFTCALFAVLKALSAL